MKKVACLGVLCAILLHGGFLLFGGIFFPKDEDKARRVQLVDLVSEEDVAAKDKPKDEPEPEKRDELAAETEEPPDAADVIRQLEVSAAASAPALEAASLSSIEQALNGGGSARGDFADNMSFASGGRIGGTGKPGSLDEKLEGAFNLAEIDQKPRAVVQSAPAYPQDMRGKKLEAVVTVIFVVDASGKVSSPRIERSSHPAFDKPALDAVKQWKFEPAFKGGQRVGCRMRVPIRFQPS